MSTDLHRTPWLVVPGALPADPGSDAYAQCDCCAAWVPEEEIEFVPAPNNAGCDAFACGKCRGEEGPHEW